MFFQHKLLVFLYCLIHLRISDCDQLHGLNRTVFQSDHPINCKRSEMYSFDTFSCFLCDSNHHLEPSFDKLSCLCDKNYKTIALYDSNLKRPVCARECQDKKVDTCNNSTLPCEFYYINKTNEQSGSFPHIRIVPYSMETLNNCSCDKRSNYIYDNFCIWKDLLKNFLNYNAYWRRGNIFADLKFIAFFCQYLNNVTSCNHLANLCVQSFFDSDKNSPCRTFFLSQASDAVIYSSIGEDLHEFRPFLFYKRGKDTIQELEKKFEYAYNNGKTSMEFSTVVYSLEGQIIRLGPFRLNHINLCDYSDGPYSNITFFKSFHFNCVLSMGTIIDLANDFANKHFFSVYLNYSLDDKRYLHAIPILIEDAFDENKKSNAPEWQMVKRFQLISANPSSRTISSQIPKYDDKLKLHQYKTINILRKFELYCSVIRDNKILMPYIVLSYHNIVLSSNTSLHDLFNFKVSIRFEREYKLSVVYKICLPIFLIVSFSVALFRSYTLRCRRYLECFDITIITQFFLYFILYTGNSFVIAVVLDATYSLVAVLNRPQMILISPNETLQIPKTITYLAIFFKGLHFATYFWNTARSDVFFVDWERPKNCETSLHVKNNLETSTQCSSIRANAENVSAWRIFFVANEWIKLSNVQLVSTLLQGFSSLILYWFIIGAYPSFNTDASGRLIICIAAYCIVHIIQRILRNTVLNKICGNPFKRFVDICTMTNVSILALVDPSYGYYIHGRSPHGSADMDMQSIVLQLHREAQNMCAKRGLLDDSNFQTYIILPPFKLSEQIQKLTHLKTDIEKVSHIHFQTESNFIGNQFEGTMEGRITNNNRLNRFLCAFIDHAIKDMDYIIKEKSLTENLLSCEFNSFLTENRGTFYIDNNITFSSLFPYGNQNNIFLMELVLLITMELLTNSFVASILIVCIYTKLFQIIFRTWVRNNIAKKTLIDKRFLM